MVRTEKIKEPSRQRIAAEKMSDAQKLHRAIQSGQLKPELRTVSQAILAATMVYAQIEKSGIYKSKVEGSLDFHVRIAYLTPDMAALDTVEFMPGKELALRAELSSPSMCAYMVGLIFALWDGERKNWIVGARQFLSTEMVNRAFDSYMTAMYISNVPPNT